MQRCIAAVGPAHHRELGRIGDAFRHQVTPGVVDVSDRRAPRHEAVAAIPVLAIARRPAEIGLEHGIAAVGIILREPVEAPFVARAGAAVRHYDRRKTARLAARRQRQIAGNGGTVGRAIGDRADIGERDVFELRAGQHDLVHLPRRLVIGVIAAGVGVAAGPDQQSLLILRRIHEADQRQVRDRLAQPGGERPKLGVEKDGFAAIGGEAGADHAVAAADAQQPVDVDAVVAGDQFALVRPVQLDPVQGLATVEAREGISDVEIRIDRDRCDAAFVGIVVGAEIAPGIGACGTIKICDDRRFLAGRAAHAAGRHQPDGAATIGDVADGIHPRALDRSDAGVGGVDPNHPQALRPPADPAARAVVGDVRLHHQQRIVLRGQEVDDRAGVCARVTLRRTVTLAQHLHVGSVGVERHKP